MKHTLLLTVALGLGTTAAHAQMAKGYSKFLGNITTSYNWVEYCDPQECDNSYKYTDYWNQVTCENATKWGSVHKGWGQFDWTNADRTYNYCKQNGVLFKFHALIWGSQHPTWIESLSVADTKKAIIEWYDEVQKHYPDLKIIDVVNEAIYSGSDYHSPYKQTKIIEALGSLAEDRLGQTFNCTVNGYPNTNSYQWLAEAFRLARERWPEAILIYNDYNTFQWQKTEFIDLVNGIKACGGPIDAAGNQAHDLNDMSGTQFKAALEEIHNKTQLPQYITEYDIAKKDDATFKKRYEEQFPIMWEADYVAGVTLWGWIYGRTWVNDGGDSGASGLVKNCSKRSAFTWLEEYMKTDAAKNAKNPLPIGSVSSISLDAELSAETIFEGDSVTISVDASTKDGNIRFVMIELNDTVLVEKWIAPYVWTFTPNYVGNHVVKVTAYDDNDKSKSMTLDLNVWMHQKPYNGVPFSIPGRIEAEEFDLGGEGNAYHDNDEQNRNADDNTVRNEGVDMNNTAVGYMQSGEWMEYTINVENTEEYTILASVASDNGTAAFTIYVDDVEVGQAQVPNTGSYTDFETVEVGLALLQAGEHVLKLEVSNSWFDIDYIDILGSTTGVDNVSASSAVPVVADGKVSAERFTDVEGVELIDATGRTVAVANGAVVAAPASKGIYLLKVKTKSNVVVKKVVIK